MNREKNTLPLNYSKKMAKEVNRKGKAEIITPQEVPMPLPYPRAAERPKLVTEKDKALVLKAISNKKGFHKVSKRTNPGTLYDSPRAHTHREGKRWVKTLAKQSREQSRSLTKNLSKTGR